MKRLALIVMLACALAKPAAARDLGEAEIEKAQQFAVGNVVWVLYHEMGHYLVNEFQVPILGREEDMVDNLATVILLEGRTAVRDAFLVASVDAFFLMGEHRNGYDMFGGHGLDEQRAFQVACMMYGADSTAFGPLADSVGLPQSRRDTCAYEYQRIRASWSSVLAPYRSSAWSSAGVAATISYDNTDLPRNAEIARILYDAQVLEVAADYISRNFVLRNQPTLRVRSCDTPNAYYEPATQTIGVCYELFEHFRQLLEEYLAKD